MFDVGFSELLLIMLVALIMVGPRQLPVLARTAGVLLGKAQRQVNLLKADIARDLRTQELKHIDAQFHQQLDDIESEAQGQFEEMRAQLASASASVVRKDPSTAT